MGPVLFPATCIGPPTLCPSHKVSSSLHETGNTFQKVMAPAINLIFRIMHGNKSSPLHGMWIGRIYNIAELEG